MIIQKKPTLLILAAGLASRYGSLKQIDRIGPSGERIIDYSVFDAIKAGFGKIVYVIRENFKIEFHEVIINELPSEIYTDTVCQELNAVPTKIRFSKERIKPWGTGHALLVASSVINEPFTVINADDFYGAESFKLAYDFLTSNKQSAEHALIGFKLNNTLSDYGSVSRGVCEADKNNFMTSIIERPEIKKEKEKILFKNEFGHWNPLTGSEIVSMNMFAFKDGIFKMYKESFSKFLKNYGNDLKAEFYLPSVVDELIKNNIGKVKILETPDSWFGLTYKEDKKIVTERINELVEKGIYPQKLWD
ncbi:MAG: nucleotidyltransferase [Ignavibacteriae bacterium]|nr:nucleotidyltransferase [Ignavibacteriota bacterium]